MTRFKPTFAMLSMIAISTLASQAQAGDYEYDRIDEMALRIELKSNEMFKEVGKHYRHTPAFQLVRKNALDMKRLAKKIHRIAHAEGDIFKLEAYLQEMKFCAAIVADQIDRIEHKANFGYGHVHGCTAHVRDLMIDLEDCINRMQRDVQVVRRRVVRQTRRVARPVWQAPVDSCPTPFNRGYDSGYGNWNSRGIRSNSSSHGFSGLDRYGISLGNGDFRVRFNF